MTTLYRWSSLLLAAAVLCGGCEELGLNEPCGCSGCGSGSEVYGCPDDGYIRAVDGMCECDPEGGVFLVDEETFVACPRCNAQTTEGDLCICEDGTILHTDSMRCKACDEVEYDECAPPGCEEFLDAPTACDDIDGEEATCAHKGDCFPCEIPGNTYYGTPAVRFCGGDCGPCPGNEACVHGYCGECHVYYGCSGYQVCCVEGSCGLLEPDDDWCLVSWYYAPEPAGSWCYCDGNSGTIAHNGICDYFNG